VPFRFIFVLIPQSIESPQYDLCFSILQLLAFTQFSFGVAILSLCLRESLIVGLGHFLFGFCHPIHCHP
jgi:hypothetical protein